MQIISIFVDPVIDLEKKMRVLSLVVAKPPCGRIAGGTSALLSDKMSLWRVLQRTVKASGRRIGRQR